MSESFSVTSGPGPNTQIHFFVESQRIYPGQPFPAAAPKGAERSALNGL